MDHVTKEYEKILFFYCGVSPDDISSVNSATGETCQLKFYVLSVYLLTHRLYWCIRGWRLDPGAVRSSHMSPIRGESGEINFGWNYPKKPEEMETMFIRR